jgi:hypothetical protein
MRKLLFLKPGSYRFTAQYDAQSSAPDSEIRWDLSCVSAKGNSGKWFTSRTVQAGRSGDAQSFTLGADCPHQLLQLQLAGGSGQLGAEFVLRSVQITPVR